MRSLRGIRDRADTPHPDPPPQGGRENNATGTIHSLPLDGGGLGWGWNVRCRTLNLLFQMPHQIILHPRDRLGAGFRVAAGVDGLLAALEGAVARRDRLERQVRVVEGMIGPLVTLDFHAGAARVGGADEEIGRASCRERVCQSV